MGLEQRGLEPVLRRRIGHGQRPAQQLVGIVGVPHPFGRRFACALPGHREAGLLGGSFHRAPHLGHFRKTAAIVFRQQGRLVAAFGRHIGVEFEGHEARRHVNFALQVFQRPRELRPADGAPRAHHVGPHVHLQFVGHHCLSSHQSSICRAIAVTGGGRKARSPSSPSSPTVGGAARAAATSSRVNQRASASSEWST